MASFIFWGSQKLGTGKIVYLSFLANFKFLLCANKIFLAEKLFSYTTDYRSVTLCLQKKQAEFSTRIRQNNFYVFCIAFIPQIVDQIIGPNSTKIILIQCFLTTIFVEKYFLFLHMILHHINQISMEQM